MVVLILRAIFGVHCVQVGNEQLEEPLINYFL